MKSVENPDVCPMRQAQSGAAQINFLQLQDNLQMYIEFFEHVVTMNGYENVLLSQFSDIWECFYIGFFPYKLSFPLQWHEDSRILHANLIRNTVPLSLQKGPAVVLHLKGLL